MERTRLEDIEPSLSSSELGWMDEICLPSTPCLQDLLNEDYYVPAQPSEKDNTLSELVSSATADDNLLSPGTADTDVHSCVCPSPVSSLPVDECQYDEFGSNCCMASSPLMYPERPASYMVMKVVETTEESSTFPQKTAAPATLLLEFSTIEPRHLEPAASPGPDAVSTTDNVKQQLRKKITTKRKNFDTIDEPAKKNEKNEIDQERYERRKLSNRKAAEKLRKKKKEEARHLEEAKQSLLAERATLEKEVASLKEECTCLEKVVSAHAEICPTFKKDLQYRKAYQRN